MKLSFLTLAFLVFAGLTTGANAMDDNSTMDKPAVTAITFYAESCGACKILEPRMKEALDSLDDATKEKINLVKFDFSNKETIQKTRELAINKGVNNILQEYGAKTGFVVLLNDKGEEVNMLKVDDSTSDIATKLTKVIASAS